MSKSFGSKPKDARFGNLSSPDVDQNPDRLPPVFSFEMMRGGNGFSVECCRDNHKAKLAERLFKLSRMTWLEIRQAHRHGFGTEKIARNAINPALPANLPDDVELLALRYSGLNPMVGYRNGRIFYILFIDHNFTCYNH